MGEPYQSKASLVAIVRAQQHLITELRREVESLSVGGPLRETPREETAVEPPRQEPISKKRRTRP